MSLQYAINAILQDNNGRHALNGKSVSFKTQSNRKAMIRGAFDTLQACNIRLKRPDEFTEKHLQKIIEVMEEQGSPASVLHNTISVIRTFCSWIGKKGMIRASKLYIKDPNKKKRTYTAEKSRCWQDNGVTVDEQIAKVEAIDPRVAIMLELSGAFGLRAKESFLIKPHLADRGAYLDVSFGTKGGRPRVVDIENAQQCEVINRAKQFVENPLDSLIPRRISLKQWRNHFYYVCRKAGITRKNGVTVHGLRHGYACDAYEKVTGVLAPVRQTQQDIIVDRSKDQLARVVVAHKVGHSRSSTTGMYTGRRPAKQKPVSSAVQQAMRTLPERGLPGV